TRVAKTQDATAGTAGPTGATDAAGTARAGNAASATRSLGRRTAVVSAARDGGAETGTQAQSKK
ncbi:MAG TPA: hypothetical protein VI456_06825, partial [Polyangia bacterium]